MPKHPFDDPWWEDKENPHFADYHEAPHYETSLLDPDRLYFPAFAIYPMEQSQAFSWMYFGEKIHACYWMEKDLMKLEIFHAARDFDKMPTDPPDQYIMHHTILLNHPRNRDQARWPGATIIRDWREDNLMQLTFSNCFGKMLFAHSMRVYEAEDNGGAQLALGKTIEAELGVIPV